MAEQTIETLVIWYTIALIVTSLQWSMAVQSTYYKK